MVFITSAGAQHRNGARREVGRAWSVPGKQLHHSVLWNVVQCITNGRGENCLMHISFEVWSNVLLLQSFFNTASAYFSDTFMSHLSFNEWCTWLSSSYHFSSTTTTLQLRSGSEREALVQGHPLDFMSQPVSKYYLAYLERNSTDFTLTYLKQTGSSSHYQLAVFRGKRCVAEETWENFFQAENSFPPKGVWVLRNRAKDTFPISSSKLENERERERVQETWKLLRFCMWAYKRCTVGL